MDIAKLYGMQVELDGRIIEKHGLRGQDLLPNTVLALQVELAEMINEWRGFKHWSTDLEPRRTKMVTEASDCLHFFLSIARQLGINPDELSTYDDHLEGGTAIILTELIWAVGKISLSNEHSYKIKAFRGAWFIFWNLLEQRLQIYQDVLYQAYLDKNAENHTRQSTGY